MTTISREHSDRLYWLGRYTERFFTTLLTLQRLYDNMIDRQRGDTEYLGYFGLPDSHGSSKAFIRSFLYEESNPNSVAYSLERAYDNEIVLREEISTESLSFLQLAKDALEKSEATANPRLSLLRLDGIPARYIAGLAYCDGETHSWVEYWTGKNWQGIDPANNCPVNDDYLILARGRDFRVCAIDRGVMFGEYTKQFTLVRSVLS